MAIIDKYDGWLVIDHEKLKDAIKRLPPNLRKFTTIRKALGMGAQQLSDYLHGKRHPNLLNFKKLCLYAQISADELLGLQKVDPPEDSK